MATVCAVAFAVTGTSMLRDVLLEASVCAYPAGGAGAAAAKGFQWNIVHRAFYAFGTERADADDVLSGEAERVRRVFAKRMFSDPETAVAGSLSALWERYVEHDERYVDELYSTAGAGDVCDGTDHSQGSEQELVCYSQADAGRVLAQLLNRLRPAAVYYSQMQAHMLPVALHAMALDCELASLFSPAHRTLPCTELMGDPRFVSRSLADFVAPRPPPPPPGARSPRVLDVSDSDVGTGSPPAASSSSSDA